MISKKKLTGLAIATAAAGLFATAMIPATAVAAEGGMVHCTGVNACKGKSDCKTADNACKGMNSCKGKGFVALSEKECKDKGGKIEAEKK
jgi:hypothetical protein